MPERLIGQTVMNSRLNKLLVIILTSFGSASGVAVAQ